MSTKSTNKNKTDQFAKFTKLLDKKLDGKIRIRGFSDIDELIDTGNYMLNAQISGSLFGGYPNTRSVEIAGESGSGKTYLCLNAAREFQNKDYYVHYIDTEGALDTDSFVSFGVDIERLNYRRIGFVNEMSFFINNLIAEIEKEPEEERAKHMIFVDSVGMLDTSKTKNDALSGKEAADMGLKAKQLRQAFRTFTLDLSSLKIPFIFTNHTSKPIDMYSSTKTSGGDGPLYAASTLLMLSKKWMRQEGEVKTRTGVIVKSKLDKNRLAKLIDIEFHISFDHGMNRFVGLQEYISWDGAGIEKGSKLTEKEFSKLKGEEADKCKEFIVNGEKFYFSPSSRAQNYINKFTGEKIPTSELFSDKLFTQDVLKELDEKIIKPMFKYSSMKDELDAEMEDLSILVKEVEGEESND